MKIQQLKNVKQPASVRDFRIIISGSCQMIRVSARRQARLSPGADTRQWPG